MTVDLSVYSFSFSFFVSCFAPLAVRTWSENGAVLFCMIDRIYFLHGYLRTWICHWRAVALMDWAGQSVTPSFVPCAYVCSDFLLLILVFMP